MQTFLIAPDSFKGSISAIEFCNIANQLQSKHDINLLCRPLSDGGEGFVDAIVYAGLAEEKTLWASNPLGRKVKAKFAWMPASNTAIIEMAQASGITCLRREDRNPLQTHSTGTGQLIKAALALGAQKIILGLGGSATNDGGVGALQALGIPFTEAKGHAINLGGQALKTIDSIGEVPKALHDIEWILACDVTNPLLGPQGATQVFAPQKGANEASINMLEQGLSHFANKLIESRGKDVTEIPGSGAAGGMAAGFIGLLDAQIKSGFDVLNDMLNLDRLFDDNAIDVLITGEGKIDEQTAFGKLPQRMARLAKQHQVKTVGLCGHLATTTEVLPEFDALFSITPYPMDEFTAFSQSPQHLKNTLDSIFSLLRSN